MQRPLGVRVLPILAVLVWALASACGNDSTGPSNGSTAALIGSYDLLSVTFQNQPPVGPPEATGMLRLADSTYHLTLTVPDQPAVVDSGTYTISGSNWTQSSSVQPVQSVGTYSLSSDTLRVNVTTLNMQLATVWLKQP